MDRVSHSLKGRARVDNEAEVPYDDVVELWRTMPGKNTRGVIRWFAPPITTRWVRRVVRVDTIAELRFLGAAGRGRWDEATGGTCRVGDVTRPSGERGALGSEADWDPAWFLTTISVDRDLAQRAFVLIDGNSRAEALWLANRSGAIPPNMLVQVIDGELAPLCAAIALAVSSAWRYG
jgi:hypothetical protein